VLTQMLELEEGNVSIINPTVAKAAGIPMQNNQPTSIRVIVPKTLGEEKEAERTSVRFTNESIKITTGFPSVAMFLSYIMVATNGDIELIEQTTTYLTWLEEWLVFYETVRGKNSTRWVDLTIRFNVCISTVRKIFISKLSIHIKCILSWPKFVTMDEDILFHKTKWDTHYSGKRIVMWDNTNVPITFKPSTADAQRNTYSMYYAGNVAKGGVFIQPCGWMGTHELWVGAVTDSDYMERSGVLELQIKYVTEYDKDYKHIPFTMILDKGYRINTVAWKSGGQLVLQPSFAKSDKKFTSRETIRNAAVASDRAANERAVRLSKLCGFFRNGLRQHECPIRLNEVWFLWAFQCNFIYQPVL
jgi:DDE superfamily endonuclease